ncbi:hypothetical protein LCGC14_1125930 [marine sediment metagenome]|uniref:Uncharacterized protein n=2 Tax=root TaxID=1 RepID=A0A831VPI9_9FLAO|nr:hypothetical protein [Methylophaga sp.]HEA19638.1 hypothetical protein [Pricia antarctica]
MSEQIKVTLTFNFADEGEEKQPDLISINDGKSNPLDRTKLIDLIILLQINKQLYDVESNESTAKAERSRLNDLKKSIALDKLGK